MWYNIPIENIPLRYSSQWNVWFPETFNRLGFQWQEIDIPPKYMEPVTLTYSDFLDPMRTIQVKSWQTVSIIDELERFDDQTVLWFHDLWHPALLPLTYLRQLGNYKFLIAGVLFAGAHDPCDRLSQCNDKMWAKRFEQSVLPQVDCMIVGSHAHRKLVLSLSVDMEPSAVHVLPYPVYCPMTVPNSADKEKLIVFPHRLAPEKQPEFAEAVMRRACEQVPDWDYVMTKREVKTRDQYHDVLRRSAICISTALQETFGIAMVESVLHNCIPLVPDRLSYHELYARNFRYHRKEQLLHDLVTLMQAWNEHGTQALWGATDLDAQRERLVSLVRPDVAVQNMLLLARRQLFG